MGFQLLLNFFETFREKTQKHGKKRKNTLLHEKPHDNT